MSEPVFEQMVKDAGIPTESDEMKSAFKQVATDNQVGFNNNSDYSPFWRLIELLVVIPTLWLIDLLKTAVLPNLFVKTATGTWLELLAFAVNITRNEAGKAVGEITFVRDDTNGELAIPLGTAIQSPSINGTVYRVITTEDASFADGVGTITVAVEAELAGSAWNLGQGFYSILGEPIAGVTSVFNADDWLSQPGVDAESDDDLRQRVRNQFLAVNQYHTDAVYRTLIAEHIGIETNQIYFEHGAPRGPGTANAYILFDANVPTQGFIDGVNQHIRDDGHHGHGDDLLSFAMPETMHDVVIDVWTIPNLSTDDTTDLQQQIAFFVRTAFREATIADYQPTQTQPWSRFSISRLGQELHREFADIDSLSFNIGDITSEMQIPRLNSLTVNMQ